MRREVLDHLQSIQFVVLLGVSIVLFAVNGLTFSKRNSEQMTRYSREVTAAQQHPSTVSTELHVSPGSLMFVSEGGDKYRPSSYSLTPNGVLTPSPVEALNHKMADIPELDWSFVIKILFSLYVLLLGYDTISGEKERGTLRQTLSHPVGRFTLLVAKYLAMLATVAVPLVIGLLISLCIVGISVPAIFSLVNVGRIALTFLLGFTYLSIFALLSVLVSSLIHDSSLVLLMLLVAWVCFAIIIPNTSGILSDKFSHVPSEYQAAKQLEPMIQQQVWARIKKTLDRVKTGELTTEEDVKRETDRAFEQGQEDLIKHYETYYHTMNQRAELARSLSRLSPTALFQYASESIAGTGTSREEQFLKDAREYGSVYDSYIIKKVGKLTPVSQWSFMTGVEVGGKTVMIRSPYPVEYQGDKSDFPQFTERPASITDSLQKALLDLGGLVLWNIVLAAFAFRAILRTDVR